MFIKEDDVRQFGHTLALSGAASVDSFLENRPEFTKVGKAAIAACLVPHEEDERLFATQPDSDGKQSWYRYFFNLLRPDLGDLDPGTLAIITYNYDRSFEHFLFTCVKNTYALEDDKCKGLVERIPILHVHGELSKLPWQDPKGGRPYNSEAKAAAIFAAASSIRVIHESEANDPVYEAARAYVRTAARLYFLGFGYHKNNVDRLGLSVTAASLPICGTAYGLKKDECRRARANISRARGSSTGRIIIDESNLDILGYLRTYRFL